MPEVVTIPDIPLAPETAMAHLDSLRTYALGDTLVPQIAQRVGLAIRPFSRSTALTIGPAENAIIANPRVDQPAEVAYYGFAIDENPSMADASVESIVAMAKARIQLERERANGNLPQPILDLEQALSHEYLQKLQEVNRVRVMQPERQAFRHTTIESLQRLLPEDQRARVKVIDQQKGIIHQQTIDQVISESVTVLLNTDLQAQAKAALVERRVAALKQTTKGEPDVSAITAEIANLYRDWQYDLLRSLFAYREVTPQIKRELIEERILTDIDSAEPTVVRAVSDFISLNHSRLKITLRESGSGGKFMARLEEVYRRESNNYIRARALHFFREEAFSPELPISQDFTSLLTAQLTAEPAIHEQVDSDVEVLLPSAVAHLLLRKVCLAEAEPGKILEIIRSIAASPSQSEYVQKRVETFLTDLDAFTRTKESPLFTNAKNPESLRVFLTDLGKITSQS